MKVQIYYSSVPGNIKVRKDTTRVQDILSARKVEFELVDVTQDNNKNWMKEQSGKSDLPQIFVDGKFVGLAEGLEEANEDGLVHSFLGISQ